ncbi:MAG: monovalent cation/H(+) antiporter subunit G [Gammaproteobacteria bacterium]
MLIDGLSFVLLLAGGALVLIGGVGLLRFPDFFTRLHAASVTETLALTLIVLGLSLHAGFSLIGLKLLLVFVFMLLTVPVATHALARAALHGRLAPKLAPGAPGQPEAAAEEPSSNS